MGTHTAQAAAGVQVREVAKHDAPAGTSAAREQSPVLLSSFMDLELLRRMLAEKAITMTEHSKDPSLKIMVYSKVTQLTGKWNAATRAARGLIVRSELEDLSDAVVVARPWEKFFTLSHHESGWHMGDEETDEQVENALELIDFTAPAYVANKVDGSLGILYRAPNGYPAVATKGTFEGDVARRFTIFLQTNRREMLAADRLLEEYPEYTFLFEMVGPFNRIVLRYDEEALILLGAVRKSDGLSVPPEEFASVWSAELELPVAEVFPAATLEEALAYPDRPDSEGFVVTINPQEGPQLLVKIKQEDYLALHHTVTSFSLKAAKHLLWEVQEATYDDFLQVAKAKSSLAADVFKRVIELDDLTDYDEVLQLQRNEYFNRILLPRAAVILESYESFLKLPEALWQEENPMKELAAQVRSLAGDSSTIMNFAKHKLRGAEDVTALSATMEIRKATQDARLFD